MRINVLEHLRREMKTGRRCRYAAFDLGIDRLIGGFVALLRRAVQIWGNGQFTHHVDNLGKTHRGIPFKVDAVGCSVNLSARSTYYALCIINYAFSRQRAFFPFFQITHQTIPGTMTCGLEHQFII